MSDPRREEEKKEKEPLKEIREAPPPKEPEPPTLGSKRARNSFDSTEDSSLKL